MLSRGNRSDKFGESTKSRVCSRLPFNPLTQPASERDYLVYSRFKRFTPGFYVRDFLLLGFNVGDFLLLDRLSVTTYGDLSTPLWQVVLGYSLPIAG